eukprot:CAMPEP_0168591092 /NCGR_PEP_ID=MMETSP0420-20121227/6939_1 /TAXON_ID=498008 /ORGANISM="Pessonella sp." /LENGTH=208 /DNA_ID=CAMNT_0008626839 /DNA_START=24 /DNA_END=647 /DNA_ORIENTATION=-
MGSGGSKSKGKKKGKITAHDQATLDLKVQRDKLRQYQKRCKIVMDKETEIAKQLLKQGKKKQALVALKKKKMQEAMLDKSQAQLENVATLIDSIESAQMEKDIFDSLKEGNQALGELHKQIGSVEDVEELLMDTEEAIARQNEIDEAFAQGVAADVVNEDDILAELAALEAEEAEETVEVTLPDAPQHDLPQQEKRTEKTISKAKKTA